MNEPSRCASCGHDCRRYEPGHSPTCSDCPCALAERVEEALRLLAGAEECEDASSLFDLCIAAREALRPKKSA